VKLNILSDLHLSRGAIDLPQTDADVVVLAGDIARPVQAVSWAAGFTKPVLYVPGNHEFYGGNIAGTVDELKRLCAGTHVHMLDNEAIVIGGVRFLGTTLWTDFLLFGEGATQAAAIREAMHFVYDFKLIQAEPGGAVLFTPADAAALFRRGAAWLQERLAEPHAGPTVVITHHAPSRNSIHPRFAGSLLNTCFVSDAEYLIDGSGACLWIHGHLHDGFDYRVNGTRVVCNPRGYAMNGVNENRYFDPHFCVDV